MVEALTQPDTTASRRSDSFLRYDCQLQVRSATESQDNAMTMPLVPDYEGWTAKFNMGI